MTTATVAGSTEDCSVASIARRSAAPTQRRRPVDGPTVDSACVATASVSATFLFHQLASALKHCRGLEPRTFLHQEVETLSRALIRRNALPGRISRLAGGPSSTTLPASREMTLFTPST